MPSSPNTQSPQKPGRRKFPLLLALLGAVVLALVLAGGGFAFAATQEQHDPFCASCHTQPESAFYQNSVGSQPVDLASVHTTYKTRCIDCHSGAGLTGRVQAEIMGARNALRFITHTDVQPARLTQPIGDENCLKCHPTVTARQGAGQGQPGQDQRQGEGEGGGEGRGGLGPNNHYHINLARWQAADPTARGCVSCHGGHTAGSSAATKFTSATQYQPVCDACHKVLRHED
jgi:nitrate/TMAO reductase-like tetraheme cytochrome c subunit